VANHAAEKRPHRGAFEVSPLSFCRIDLFDLATFVVFICLSIWTTFLLAIRTGPDHIWTGTNGLYLGDQMQYLGWIRSSHTNLLIGNPYVTSGGIHDFLNPGLAISEILVDLGMSTWLSYLIWTPIAAVIFAVAVRLYVHRIVTSTAARRMALVLALFYLSPLSLIASSLHWNQVLFFQSFGLEMWPINYLWGYPLTAIAVAAMIGALLNYERARDERRLRLGAPLCALLCAWLQPWQGATLIVILLGCELYLRFRTGKATQLLLPGITLGAGALPLFYYFLLGHFDPSWKLADQADSQQLPSLPIDDLILSLLPLLIFAALAYWRYQDGFQFLTARIWPICAVAVLYMIAITGVGTFPKHALQGLAVPLSILAVCGVTAIPGAIHSRSSTLFVAILVAGLITAPVGHELAQIENLGDPSIFFPAPFFLRSSEADALRYLAQSPEPGSVLSTVYLGQIVPAETGRPTWVGIYSFTPAYAERVDEATRLFSGQMTKVSAVSFVRSTGAKFVLSDCSHPQNLSSLLGSDLQATIHFGCASVYMVKRSSSS